MPHCKCCDDRVQGALDAVDFQVHEYEEILREKDREIALYKENYQLRKELCRLCEQKIQRLEAELRRRGVVRSNWRFSPN